MCVRRLKAEAVYIKKRERQRGREAGKIFNYEGQIMLYLISAFFCKGMTVQKQDDPERQKNKYYFLRHEIHEKKKNHTTMNTT